MNRRDLKARRSGCVIFMPCVSMTINSINNNYKSNNSSLLLAPKVGITVTQHVTEVNYGSSH